MTHLVQALGACCLKYGIERSVERFLDVERRLRSEQNELDSGEQVGRKDEGRRLEIKSTGQDFEFAKNFRH